MLVKWPEFYGVPYENANVTKGESVFNLSPDMMKMYTQYIWLSELTILTSFWWKKFQFNSIYLFFKPHLWYKRYKINKVYRHACITRHTIRNKRR